MRILVKRRWFTAHATTGELFLDGLKFGYTLEPPKREEKPCAIPEGTYDVTIRWSEKFSRLMPHVEDVPGFTAVEIHWGNFPRDTEACLLIGLTRDPQQEFIGQSKLAFD